MCSLPRSRGPRLSPGQLRAVIADLREYLEISQAVCTEAISRFQVTDELGRPGAGLIGVVFDAYQATIYHTRTLTPEDVLHELLHVAHPTWSEAAVVHATTRGWRRHLPTHLPQLAIACHPERSERSATPRV
jgi:hypothetical protein